VLEDASAGSRVAELLLRRRVSRLAVLHGAPLTQVTKRRVKSFERRSKGLNGDPVWMIQAERLDEEAGYEAMNRLFKCEGRAFDGLYAISDALALGAYRSITEHGFRIPRDISVIGVGDHEMSSFFDPPLSCVGVSHRELAAATARLLFRQLFEQDGLENVFVPFSETIRGSLKTISL
jgi:LacI family transcriptional regulator